ncbi:MAG TPA: hypothetical protein VJK71_08160, partial [Gemmatimonadales bacterium]|nr:hypothetical protein [Gemmatimonadales bacterium]
MVPSRTKAAIARWHRWLGLALSVPLLGWIVSSAAMMLVTMNAEQGLAGVYRLRPHNTVDRPLDRAAVLPGDLLRRLERELGLPRVFWIRLESRGPHLLYVVKPTPFSLALVFDAMSGRRLDPLSDSLLLATANEALLGTHAVTLEDYPEYNRYYDLDRVPAVRVTMQGEQPSQLILSRDQGRTLRRVNPDAGRFAWWYRTFHVNQWGDDQRLWTVLLYGMAAGAVVLATLGFQLYISRRGQASTASPSQKLGARRLHRTLGLLVGGMLALQVVVGSYLWLNLGPLEDPFRGKGSFNPTWAAGITTAATLDPPATVLQRTRDHLLDGFDGLDGPRPVQSIEWRNLGGRIAWIVAARRDSMGTAFDAMTGQPFRLSPDEAGRIAQQEVAGMPPFEFRGEGQELWMDVNRSVPIYRLRFEDLHRTDVLVSSGSGQIIQRRPAIWRA